MWMNFSYTSDTEYVRPVFRLLLHAFWFHIFCRRLFLSNCY